MKGKGIIGDIAADVYSLGAKVLTGEQPSVYNKFAQPKLNPNFGLHDLRPITFDPTSGPGTNIDKQLPKVMASVKNKNAQPITAISASHDIAYEIAGSSQNKKQAQQKVRQADNQMLDQLSTAMSKEATVKNFLFHPWKTTADLANDTVGYLGIKAKVIGEDLGLVSQYGANGKKISNAKKTMLLKKKQELQDYLQNKKY